MSLITFPSGINFSNYTLKMVRKTIVMQSPFSGKRQVMGQPFALWNFQGTFSQQVTDNAGLLRSFLMQLEGQTNTFQFSPPEYVRPSTGYVGAAGLVNGASQIGKTLVTDGWTASAAIFKVGDYFTVNGEYKIVTAVATANGTGQVTISFSPALRSSPADNAALTIVNPYVILAAIDDEQASWDVTPPIEYQMKLSAQEAF